MYVHMCVQFYNNLTTTKGNNASRDRAWQVTLLFYIRNFFMLKSQNKGDFLVKTYSTNTHTHTCTYNTKYDLYSVCT